MATNSDFSKQLGIIFWTSPGNDPPPGGEPDLRNLSFARSPKTPEIFVTISDEPSPSRSTFWRLTNKISQLPENDFPLRGESLFRRVSFVRGQFGPDLASECPGFADQRPRGRTTWSSVPNWAGRTWRVLLRDPPSQQRDFPTARALPSQR